jgi:hypothetical protein
MKRLKKRCLASIIFNGKEWMVSEIHVVTISREITKPEILKIELYIN